MAAIVSPTSCGFAKVAIFLCGQHKELYEGDKIVDLPVVQQLKRFTNFFFSEKYIIDLQTFRTGYTRLKNIIKKRFKHDSDGRKSFFDIFSPLNFKKLTEIEKTKHQLKDCQECQQKFRVGMNIFATDSEKQKKKAAITKAKTQKAKQHALKSIENLEEAFSDTFNTSFLKTIIKIPELGIQKKIEKNKRKQQKSKQIRNIKKT